MTAPTFQHVAVLGGGTMGSGIAQVCAQAVSEVRLFDINQEAVDSSIGRIDAFLSKGVARGKVSEEEKTTTLARITGHVSIAETVEDTDLVIEAVPEKLDLKNKLFSEVAGVVEADTVLATNTSSLSLQKIFDGVPSPERCIGMHFFNPVPIMALLEVVRMDVTSQGTIDRVYAYSKHIEKEPILIQDSPGFASSRLGVCLGLEAIRMVEAGVASPEDIDKAMELGYRHPMGPLKLTDLVGLDVRMHIADYLSGALDSPAFAVPQLMRDKVERGELGKKSGKGFYDWSE